MNFFKRYFGHLHTVNTHRRKVRHLCFKCGLYWQGLTHDLSKYSPEEFWEGVKYFQKGEHSPISDCKKAEGYSRAWLHHKGRNKHHFEYWTDLTAPVTYPLMPYKYIAESICDNVAAGMIYEGKNWTKDYQLNYFVNKNNKGRVITNEVNKKIYLEAFEGVAREGISFLTKKNLKAIYKKYEESYKEERTFEVKIEELI